MSIEKVNIDGSLASVDLYELKDLGDAAIPAIVDLAEYFHMEGVTVDSYAEKLGDEDSNQRLRYDLENYLKLFLADRCVCFCEYRCLNQIF